MEKSHQNQSEGILGAIKAVTSKPVVTPLDEHESERPTSLGDNKIVRTKSTSEVIQEIERSRAARHESKSEKIQRSTRNEVSPTSAKNGFGKRVLETDGNTSEPFADVATESKGAPSNKLDPGLKRPTTSQSKKKNSVEAVASTTPNKIEPGASEEKRARSTVNSDPDAILPSDRPASINRDVDQVLDSLLIDPKCQAYLIEKIRTQVSSNLLHVDEGDICKPDMAIAGPMFNALAYVYHQPQIVSLYANLISTAMTGKTARFAHPGFVDLIRNITEDEARVLSWFHKNKVLPVIDIKKVLTKRQSEMRLNTLVSCIAQEAGCQFDDLAEGYLANLERVGLLEIPRTTCLTDDSLYKNVLSIPAVEERLNALNTGNEGFRGEVVKYYAKLSVYGIRFCYACIR